MAGVGGPSAPGLRLLPEGGAAPVTAAATERPGAHAAERRAAGGTGIRFSLNRSAVLTRCKAGALQNITPRGRSQTPEATCCVAP